MSYSFFLVKTKRVFLGEGTGREERGGATSVLGLKVGCAIAHQKIK